MAREGLRRIRGALRGFGVPVLNVVVACQDGDIALKTAGLVPERRPGSGLAPAPFAEVARSWERFLDFDALPETVNPQEGYIVSANHKMVPDDAPVQVGVDWVAPYRAERIEELIVGAGRVSADDCARWQGDEANGRARRVLPALLEALAEQPPEERIAAACHALLKEWDGVDSRGQAAPLVFFRLMQVLSEHWVTSRLGAELAGRMPDISLQVDHLITDGAARLRLGDDAPCRASWPRRSRRRRGGSYGSAVRSPAGGVTTRSTGWRTGIRSPRRFRPWPACSAAQPRSSGGAGTLSRS